MNNKPAIQHVVLGEHQKLKEVRVHGTTATGWQAQYALELAKILSGAWPTGENDAAGFLRHRWPTPDEVVGRAFEITEKMVAGCAARGWSVTMPALSELLDEGSKVGFMAGDNGKAGPRG